MQTLADLADRLGSEEAARMAVGNLNNLIALRSKDRPTQDFIVETFGKTAIHTMRIGLNTAADAHLGDFTSAHTTQVTESWKRPFLPTSSASFPTSSISLPCRAAD